MTNAAALWAPVLVPAPPLADCWCWWSAERIASCAQSAQRGVDLNWPLLFEELRKREIDDRSVCAAAIATTAIETASTFAPCREAFWTSEAWREENLRYYPYYGRGYIQLTWDYNYRTYGGLIGCDLAGEPDMALDAAIGAAVFAEYFVQRGVAEAARAGNWGEVRRRVQGAHAGLERLEQIVHCLGVA